MIHLRERARLIGVVFICALALPSVGHANHSKHRMKTAGIASTAVGLALAFVGAVLTGYGETHPRQNHGLQPLVCTDSGCGLPPPTNQMLIGGTATLAVGVFAIGVGIPLWVAGDRTERPATVTVAAGAGGLRLSF